MSTPTTKPTLPTPVRGDIFEARLDPTEGSEQAGIRPVIIVSRNSINAHSPVVVVVPTTDADNPKRIYPSHCFLAKGLGGLTKDSVAKTEQIRTIQKERFIAYYGRLDQDAMRSIDTMIKTTLALR
jgi:mRNA interferase MazF